MTEDGGANHVLLATYAVSWRTMSIDGFEAKEGLLDLNNMPRTCDLWLNIISDVPD